MVWSPSTPVTGATVTGLASPTYTLTPDSAPTQFGKQHAVTALGGTQTGVLTHSVSSPFTLTFEKPSQPRSLPAANNLGQVTNVPRNTYKVRTRKGVVPLNLNPSQIMTIETIISVPAGADSFDSANIRAALSLHIGALTGNSSGIGDTILSNVM